MAGSSKEKEEEGETMNVQNRKLSELTQYLGNAKKHDKKKIAMEKFIKRQRRKEGVYGKAEKGDRSKAVRESMRPAMHA